MCWSFMERSADRGFRALTSLATMIYKMVRSVLSTSLNWLTRIGLKSWDEPSGSTSSSSSIGSSRYWPPHRLVDGPALEDGHANIGDVVPVAGGCPRYVGDEVDLIGGYTAIVISHDGQLYYLITDYDLRS